MKLNFDNKFLKNSFYMYLLTIAKILMPFVTLPYLTRVLSVETYGVVVYVKSILRYVQLVIDFGFLLSVTKEIVLAKKENNWKLISHIISTTLVTRAFLGLVSLIIFVFLINVVPILTKYSLFSILMFISVFLNVFLVDFLFRGIEEMGILTKRFLISKSISAILIFLLIQSDTDLILMAVIEILGSLLTVILTYLKVRKLSIYFVMPQLRKCWLTLSNSFVVFLSGFSTTAFGIFITFLIGIYLKAEDIAFWSLAVQMLSGIQAFYSPIIVSLYPAMVRNYNLKLIAKILAIFIPLIFIGSSIIYFFGTEIITLIAGDKYSISAKILIYLIPVIIFSFPAMIFGWPILGALGKNRDVTFTTVFAAIIQVSMLVVLIKLNLFDVWHIAISRGITEIALFTTRFMFFYNYKFGGVYLARR